jgi:dienelactone hydrolase
MAVAQRRNLTSLVVIGALLFLCASNSAWAQQLRVSPSPEALFADRLHIVLTEFNAGAEVEIRAERSMTFGGPAPQLFRSSARFLADANGRVDLASAAPIAGSYTGVDPMGLFWSMSAVPEAPSVDRYSEVRLAAYAKGRLLASTTVNIHGWLPSVEIRDVAAFPGSVFAAMPGAGRLPAIILLHGSDGGSGTVRVMAPMFASRGYAVLGLPYYSPPDQNGRRELEALPAAFSEIPIDRLEQARAWLARQPTVDAERIGLWGYSKGAEFALVAAAHFPWIRAVVASAPSDVIWEGWGPNVAPGPSAGFSFHGRSLPFVPYDYRGVGIYDSIAGGRRAHPDRAAAARISVETFKGDLLVAGAGKDATWDSAYMAQNIAERRAEAGLKTTLLIFPDAGHGLTGDPWAPKGEGAAAEAESQAQRTMWAETFDFFNRTLGAQ